MIAEMRDAAIDPIVKDVALRHLQTLATLLAHIPIFGLEAAMTQYFDLIAKFRRADAGATPEAQEKAKPLWDRITGWSDRFEKLDKVMNAGARLMHRGAQGYLLLEAAKSLT